MWCNSKEYSFMAVLTFSSVILVHFLTGCILQYKYNVAYIATIGYYFLVVVQWSEKIKLNVHTLRDLRKGHYRNQALEAILYVCHEQDHPSLPPMPLPANTLSCHFLKNIYWPRIGLHQTCNNIWSHEQCLREFFPRFGKLCTQF